MKQLAEVLNISSQGVSDHTKRGNIQRDNEGLYNLNDPVNVSFLKARGIDVKKIVIPESKPAGRPVQKREQGTIKHTTTDNKTLTELNREKVQAQIEKIKLETATRRGELLESHLVNDYLFLFLDTVCNSMQRNAAAFLSDVASTIIENNGLNSAIRNQWQNMVLSQFDNARSEIIKRISKIQEMQK